MRWTVALVVALLASGCLQTEDGQDGGATDSPSTLHSRSSTSTSRSDTYTPPPPPPPAEWDAGAWVAATCPALQPIMAPYLFRDIAVRYNQSIAVLRNGPDHKYEVHATGADGTRFLAAAYDAVYAGKDVDLPSGRIVQYDAGLDEVRSVQVGQVGSITRDGDVLYVGGLGNLTTLTLDLQVLDVLHLSGTPYVPKRIDAVTVHHRSTSDVVAYLVDDVVFPYRVYRVDATDPSHLAELGNDTVSSSGSPGPQWIDPQAHQWYVATNFYGMGVDGVGGSESAKAIGLDGQPAAKPVPLHGTLDKRTGRDTETGFDVAASDPFLPGWAVLQGDGNRTFARIAFQDGVPSHACDLALGAADGPAAMAYDGPWPVVAASRQLWVLDPGRGPIVARSQTLPFEAGDLAILA